jgi:hypothetical protein
VPSFSTSGTLLVRVVFVRALAFVYTLFFAIALSQNKALIGDEGITPAKRVLDQAQAMGTFKRHQRRLQHEKLQSARRDNEANSTVVSRRLRGWWRRMGRPWFDNMCVRCYGIVPIAPIVPSLLYCG